ncbi:MAG: hypothetical protein A2622_08845 [Bdellovibrionales bacterium RIFCSPHIGHO2_01_FULL_40_29]|nr:MAG: hypothetical protein A2622_08845 [Bdellovibrionales bacterium RIFCSPHIGHO2_01_FULL_40_29]OFZ32846.1 MAG: hypothetical protein A3D17_09055 [Bdellovibrionales bacterium RIFCSPHIGHO2_02_FULL_40_15]
MMKLTTSQIQRLSEKILNQWKKENLITFKSDEKVVLSTINESITAEFKMEDNLDREVMGMIDELQRQHGSEFQRHKMFPILKQKLAKERKIIL